MGNIKKGYKPKKKNIKKLELYFSKTKNKKNEN